MTAALALVVALLGAAFVWPTPYRPIALRAGGRPFLAAREQRFTGRVDVLTVRGWEPLAVASDPLVARMRGLIESGAVTPP